MEIINQIIAIILSDLTNEEIFQTLGSVKKRIGNNLILDPKIKGLRGIGLVLANEKISTISFSLEESIPFKKLYELFTDFYLGYSHYDGISGIVFKLNNNFMLIAQKNGYISRDEVHNYSFVDFELKKK
jgi:hypothetical protein